jgi:hypothetical protein
MYQMSLSRRLLLPSLVFAVLAFSFGASGSEIPVFPVVPTGETFTNNTGVNQGQSVGASGWYYNNVRNSGVVGITDNYPNASTGSAWFHSPTGSAKADLEYLAGGVNLGGNYFASSSLGLLADLVSFQYEWFRDPSSTVDPNLHPALRVLLDADGDLTTTGDRGGLVFERVYNSLPVSTNVWVSDMIGSSTYLWNFGLGIGFAANINASPYAYDATLAEWQAYFPNAVILGFSAGVGSGWNGVFTGAVDRIGWTIGDTTTVSNFEVQAIPEPSSVLLVLGGLGFVLLRRRAAVLR